ncbi:DUF1127 domain-containing protein [Trabulsiella odontotermitis]|uniref:DUF1127 domain-containing protein n=1 Tax=Trabulsiella odontotermitis TaxID=379893 RepID=UPI0006769F3E
MDCKRKKSRCFIRCLLFKTISKAIFISFVKYLKRVQSRRKSTIALQKMSDEQLKDIGLTRDDIP